MHSVSVPEQFSFSCTVCANSLSGRLVLSNMKRVLGRLGDSPALPSVPLGEWREINGCKRLLRF